MGINVSTSMGFENRDFLKDTAKQILKKGGAEEGETAEIVQKVTSSIMERQEMAYNGLRAAAQITLNNSLNETLRYLRSHANDKRKKYVLGELWEQFGGYDDEEASESGLIDLEIDFGVKNIFAA